MPQEQGHEMRLDKRWWLVVVLAGLVAAFYALDLGQYLSLATIKSRQAELEAWRAAQPLLAALLFFAGYVAVTALSLPGAAVMTLAAGAVFGLGWGTLIVSFGSTIGATLAFLTARWLLGDWVQARFGERMAAINAGVARDGGFYLFTLRLVPVFPFFMINLVMGLTSMRPRTFYWVSQLGMLAGTLVYVNAGTQLARIDSLSGIVSPGLLGSLVLLGVFPLVARKIVDAVQARKVYARWKRPKRFDRNLVVIGGGSAGLVTAYIAAAVKAKVTLVEKHAMGGDCLNTGCVPSKALIRSAKFLSHVKRSQEFGIRSAQAEFDFAEVMERVQRVVERGRAARLGGALHEPRRRRGRRQRAHRLALGSGDHAARRQRQAADDAQHRHRRRRAALRAADSRHRPGRGADLRQRLGPAPAARAAGGARRRPDRQRTDAGLRPPGLARSRRSRWRRASCCARTRTSRTWSPRASAPKASPCSSATRPSVSKW